MDRGANRRPPGPLDAYLARSANEVEPRDNGPVVDAVESGG
jgi:hypothetical protein